MMGYGAENGGFENDDDDEDDALEADLLKTEEQARLKML